MKAKPASQAKVFSVEQAAAIKWPALPFTRDDLHLETLLDDQICLIGGLFTAKECSRWIAFCSSLPLTASPAARRGEAHRTNDRFSVIDPAFAHDLWAYTALSALFNPPSHTPTHKPLTLNPNIRIYKYSTGQEFRKHYDDEIIDPISGLRSEWTLLIYLSGIEDGVEGGETSFETGKGKELVVGLSRGTALFHRHGRDCLLHEGKPVKKGVKWVLRSDVLFG